MNQENTTNVVALPKCAPRTYSAKAFHWHSDSLCMQTSGTLEGLIDIALFEGLEQRHIGTHQITCDEARALAVKLLGVADDVQANCLFERDALLIDGRPVS